MACGRAVDAPASRRVRFRPLSVAVHLPADRARDAVERCGLAWPSGGSPLSGGGPTFSFGARVTQVLKAQDVIRDMVPLGLRFPELGWRAPRRVCWKLGAVNTCWLAVRVVSADAVGVAFAASGMWWPRGFAPMGFGDRRREA
ncbi:hypothetical protein GCM10010191_91130 [Actinomadura vinacea]|uniref:Uncharacterized protein n=1 Tax=Actinomadura vinacea TaxID=115336 RepID=A0ABN3KHJ1_9ACTN